MGVGLTKILSRIRPAYDARVVNPPYQQEGISHWWWLLTTEIEGAYYVCLFGSLLPYLTGRTAHIVHNIGDCAVCSGMDPLL
jgi:hypothetical protein